MESLAGKRGLVIGIASEKSIAYGCAQACQEQGAELAVTYLNDKALQHVRPLAEGLNVLTTSFCLLMSPTKVTWMRSSRNCPIPGGR